MERIDGKMGVILEKMCSPALIYIAFSLTHIVIEMFRSNYNTAFIKFIVMIIFTLLLNILCSRGLTIVSWFIVFIPFIVTTFITTIMVFTFGTSFVTGDEGGSGSNYELNYY